MFFIGEAKNEAVAYADAHATNTGLPSYSDLLSLAYRMAYPEEGSSLQLNDYRQIARNILEPDGCQVVFP